MVSHSSYLLCLQPSPYPRPIAPISTWCHNALLGCVYSRGITRAGNCRCHCETQGTSPPATVSNNMSGQRLGSSCQPAEPSGRTRGWPERQTVSDWASALSWGRDESELVSELQAGSETAFDWLVTHYHGPVYNLILGMLADTADAADAAQEVFLKAFKGIRNFRQGSSLKTWLYRIAIREALNHRRWFKRHLQKNVSIDAEPEEGAAHIEIEDLAGTPFDQLAAHEIQQAVQSALQQVPDVFRSAVILRDLEGLSYEEVAEVLDCSVGTVKSRILRGRRALKDILEPLLGEKEALRRREVPARTSLPDRSQPSPATAVHNTSSVQIGLPLAYVQNSTGITAQEMSRPLSTREELS
jgi:RNA polymerase sigma-70 factor, ECF subfamily